MRRMVPTILKHMAGKRGLWLKLATGPAVIAIGVVGLSSPGHASDNAHIEISDDCNPATFNAAIPQIPNLCQGHGDTPFPTFLAKVGTTGEPEQWNFEPKELDVKAGEAIVLNNTGGETHTVTNVDAFGGGYIIPLNGLLAKFGLGTPRPECLANGQPTVQIPGLLLAPAPESATNRVVHFGETDRINTGSGTPFPARDRPYLFECCVHPWMQTTVFVNSGNGKAEDN